MSIRTTHKGLTFIGSKSCQRRRFSNVPYHQKEQTLIHTMKRENHSHIYNKAGNIICCSLEEKIDIKTPPKLIAKEEKHQDGDGHDHSHDGEISWKTYLPAIISLGLLLSGLVQDFSINAISL